jgi:hypothetical protein
MSSTCRLTAADSCRALIAVSTTGTPRIGVKENNPVHAVQYSAVHVVELRLNVRIISQVYNNEDFIGSNRCLILLRLVECPSRRQKKECVRLCSLHSAGNGECEAGNSTRRSLAGRPGGFTDVIPIYLPTTERAH